MKKNSVGISEKIQRTENTFYPQLNICHMSKDDVSFILITRGINRSSRAAEKPLRVQRPIQTYGPTPPITKAEAILMSIYNRVKVTAKTRRCLIVTYSELNKKYILSDSSGGSPFSFPEA